MKTISRKVIRSILFIILFIWITSCAGTKATSENTTSNNTIQDSASEIIPQIVFLNFSIWRDQTEQFHVELINQIVSKGNIKEGLNLYTTPKEGDLKCFALDENKHPISSILVPNPLVKRIEYQQEDGSMTSREIFLDSTEFSIRMQLNEEARYVAIERINPTDSSFLVINEIQGL